MTADRGEIGYYIHHHGSGHLNRARAIANVLGPRLTGLSTHPRPTGWPGDWIELADDADPTATADPAVWPWLHYVPRHHPGLRTRMAAISAWIGQSSPAALVVDVSVEVAVLARLHGVPVITMAQPGVRTDPAHTLGYQLSETVIAPWPASTTTIWQADPGTVPVRPVGTIARFAPAPSGEPYAAGRVVVLNGTGGPGLTEAVRAGRAAAPSWDWIQLDRAAGTWVEDPWPLLTGAAVVISHCGQNAVAEIAAARRPAILIPQERPFGEQLATASALRSRPELPVEVLDDWPTAADWPGLLTRMAARDGQDWSAWNDGEGAERAAAVITEIAPERRTPESGERQPMMTGAGGR